MREFVLYSRLGRTDSKFTNLHYAGRLDVVYECLLASLFLSHGIRKDVVFHAVLSGPPSPPKHLAIEGAKLHDVRTDEKTWETIIKKVLAGHIHPGITLDRTSFEQLLRNAAEASNTNLYVLEEKGKSISDIRTAADAMFILGDHIGLPKTAENYALRYAEKISLGRKPYLAASCITILNYLLDLRTAESETALDPYTNQP
jgi:tRNA (pseudouridine54-N1)-methyltransferase